MMGINGRLQEFENGTSPSGSSGGSGGSDVHHHGQLVQLVKRQRGKVDEQQQRLAQLEQELIVSEANLANIQQLDHDQTLQLARQLTHLQQVSHQHDTEVIVKDKKNFDICGIFA